MIDLENASLREAEQAAYAAGDTLKAKLLERIMDLEDELARINCAAADEFLAHGPASAYVEFFFECFEHLRCRYPIPSITSETDKQVIFDAIARGEG